MTPKPALMNWHNLKGFRNWKKKRLRGAVATSNVKTRHNLQSRARCMNSLSSELSSLGSSSRALLLILALSAAISPEMRGQTAPSGTATSSAVNAHFAAAQQAQSRQDYATAEREYQAVIAEIGRASCRERV